MERQQAAAEISRMMTGYWVSQSVYAAARLGLADLVKDEPQTAEQLAETTGTHPRSLYRLLRALASVGIFAADDQQRFALTPLANTLCSDVPDSQRAIVLMMGELQYDVWGDLLYSVRTGEIAFDKTYGKPIFEYLAEHPERAQVFEQAMAAIHGHETDQIVEGYDFGKFSTIADVGGGNGSQLAMILQQHPSVKGILLDQPHVVQQAGPILEQHNVADRCQVEGGDFFQSVPAGADAYLLRHIIHDWDDENAITILHNCRDALGPHGKLLLVEFVIPPGNGPFFGKLLDLNMLLIPGGMERTEHEYRELLQDAGLKLEKIIPTSGELSVIEAGPFYPEEVP
jgi:hypothetical protein